MLKTAEYVPHPTPASEREQSDCREGGQMIFYAVALP